MLQEIIDFTKGVSDGLKLPSKNTCKSYALEQFVELKAKVENSIKQNCLYFCTT